MKKPANSPNKTEKRRKGDVGEEVVCKYLENKGYFVKARNYWKPWGEIDIVATKGGEYRFIEVKTARLDSTSASRQVSRENVAREMGVRPEENFHPAKLKKLYRAIQTYLLQHKVPESAPWQIDLACVYLNFETKRARVELFENVIL